jgi:hypothetical protein
VGLNNTGSGKGASTRESEGRESVENEGYTSENPDSQRQSSSGERGSFEASGELGRSLTPEYRRELEEAFVANHHYGSRPESISEAVRSITLQTQMYLQRLNYLSVSYKISGEYDDITLRAVQTFQRAHNHHEARFSVALPESGCLTSTTFQFLRQAYLIIYASMVRIGLDKHLGENFDPMSTAPRDVGLFRECVAELQERHRVRECQTGAVCASTIHKMKQLLQDSKNSRAPVDMRL